MMFDSPLPCEEPDDVQEYGRVVENAQKARLAGEIDKANAIIESRQLRTYGENNPICFPKTMTRGAFMSQKTFPLACRADIKKAGKQLGKAYFLRRQVTYVAVLYNMPFQ